MCKKRNYLAFLLPGWQQLRVYVMDSSLLVRLLNHRSFQLKRPKIRDILLQIIRL
jgi:hypothetical protein